MNKANELKLFLNDYFKMILELIENDKKKNRDVFPYYSVISLMKEQIKSFGLENDFPHIMKYDERQIL